MIATRCPSGRPAPTPRRCGPAPARTATTGCSTAPSAGSPTAACPTWYTVMAVDRPGQGRQRHLGVRGAQGRPGLRRRAQGAQARHQGLAHQRALLRELPHPGRPDHRRARHRASRPRCARSTTPARPSARRPSASRRARWTPRSHYVKDRKQFGKPIADFQGVQFMLADMAMKIEAARQLVYAAAARAERGEPNAGLHLRRRRSASPPTSRWR